jgi:hypothetical protein
MFFTSRISFLFPLSSFAIVANWHELILIHILLDMAVPQVDKKMLGELEVMGFPAVRSIRALHYSGTCVSNEISR